jgi:triphosphoribosyl-dephospho-CoA synthase
VNQQALAALFKDACLAELTALKPGNVHVFADGHGMVVEDFLKSAEAAAIPISQSGIGVGSRILAAMQATWQVVACNTNVGILLLSAPLLQAGLSVKGAGFRTALGQVLLNLTIDDASQAYQAIRLASPAGLGDSASHDVNRQADVSLLEAMRFSAERDLIARQYVNNYADIFDVGIPAYQHALHQWNNPAWATSVLYLTYLSRYPDSHVVRKYGASIAQQVMEEAAEHLQVFQSQENPKHYQRALLDFDASLKARHINPGTCADLTVATLIALALSADTTA